MSLACLFTPGYTKFGAFWAYMRRVMAEIRFDILAKFWLKLLSDPHVLVAINLGDFTNEDIDFSAGVSAIVIAKYGVNMA